MKKFYYLGLIVLNAIIVWLELSTGTVALRLLAIHMLMHCVFFLGMMIGDASFIRHRATGLIAFIVLTIFSVFRIHEMVELFSERSSVYPPIMMLMGIIALLIFQQIILHRIERHDGTCSVICHIAGIHIWGDIAVTGSVLIGTLLQIKNIWIADILLSLLVLVWMWHFLYKIARQFRIEKVSETNQSE